jgi:type IX secretion system PorP/SprF family membrane protein
MYSYLLNINRKFSMRFGLQASYGQRSIDWSRLTFGDQIDARYGFIYNTQEQKPQETTRFFDVNAGIVAYTDKFYGGVAVSHLTMPNEGFLGVSRLPIKVTVHAGALFQLNKRSKYVSPATISPNVLFQLQQNFRQLNIGLYATKGVFVGGLWYRNLDSFILLAGIQKNGFKIGYSYDFTISKLTNATGGAHEVSLGFIIPCRPPMRRFRTVRCPSF